MSLLTFFGLIAVVSMLVCYGLEDRHSGFILGFAAACGLGSVYGFLQGACYLGWLKVCGRSLPFGGGGKKSV